MLNLLAVWTELKILSVYENKGSESLDRLVRSSKSYSWI